MLSHPSDAARRAPTAQPALAPASTPTGSPRPRAASDRVDRNHLVEQHLVLAERFVRRYAGRGVPRDDLRQSALLALVQAADRFDPTRGIEFRSFATATIDGTLKRYFRDLTWAVRPPRRIQELHLRVRRADEELSQHLGRRPSVSELARALEEDEDDIHQALEASMAHGAVSVDAPSSATDTSDPGERPWLGVVDRGFGSAEARLVLRDVLDGLPDRHREILHLRFVENLTQQEIGERLGMSQSYLSRVLRGVLRDLRGSIGDLDLRDGSPSFDGVPAARPLADAPG